MPRQAGVGIIMLEIFSNTYIDYRCHRKETGEALILRKFGCPGSAPPWEETWRGDMTDGVKLFALRPTCWLRFLGRWC